MGSRGRGGENGLLQSSLFNGYGINAEGSFRMGIGIGEMRDHPDYVTGVLKNFSRNRGRRGHHFFEESLCFGPVRQRQCRKGLRFRASS